MNRSDTPVVSGLYQAWNNRDIDSWVRTFASDATWTNLPTGEQFIGPEGMAQNYRNWDGPFADGKCAQLTFGGGGGLIVAEFVALGTHTGQMDGPNGPIEATGRSIEVPFCDLHQVQDGRIRATRRYWDQLGVLAQLGLA